MESGASVGAHAGVDGRDRADAYFKRLETGSDHHNTSRDPKTQGAAQENGRVQACGHSHDLDKSLHRVSHVQFGGTFGTANRTTSWAAVGEACEFRLGGRAPQQVCGTRRLAPGSAHFASGSFSRYCLRCRNLLTNQIHHIRALCQIL